MKTFSLTIALLMILPCALPAQVLETTEEFTVIVEPPETCGGDPVVYTAQGPQSHLISAADAAECRLRIEVRGGAGGTPTGTGKNASGGRGAVITFDYEASGPTELRLHVGRAGAGYSSGGEASAVKTGTTLLTVAGGGGSGGRAYMVDTRQGSTGYAYAGMNGGAPSRTTINVPNDSSSFGILPGTAGQTRIEYSSYSTGCIRYYSYGGAGGSGYTAGSGGTVSRGGYCSGPRYVYAYGGQGGGSFLSTVPGITPVSNGTGDLSGAGRITISKVPQ